MEKEKWENQEADSDDDSENDLDYQPNPEDEEESDIESEPAHSDEEDDEPIQSKKRKRPVETVSSVANTADTDDAERERKKRIDAIWAEMNSPSTAEKSTKQPLDDISSSMNRPSEAANQADSKNANKIPTPASSEASSPADSTTTASRKPAISRPKSNLSALVSQYNIKTPKMNTLDKSKLDWQGYVDREGIREDLKYKNKDGYMEKVEFLQRVDDRRIQDLKAGQRSASKKK
ncbi:bucentaur or craniofacial development-domain-containing protein [Umbelopsis sp. PMI_123]|nr:bucentaur or craniofacial development-domain-containing protein [Umbelopsis sp. PMI_123]